MRNDRAKWLSVTLGLTLAVVMLSGWMRQLHTGQNLSGDENGVRIEIESGVGMERGSDTRYQDDEAGANFRKPAEDASEAAPEAAPSP